MPGAAPSLAIINDIDAERLAMGSFVISVLWEKLEAKSVDVAIDDQNDDLLKQVHDALFAVIAEAMREVSLEMSTSADARQQKIWSDFSSFLSFFVSKKDSSAIKSPTNFMVGNIKDGAALVETLAELLTTMLWRELQNAGGYAQKKGCEANFAKRLAAMINHPDFKRAILFVGMHQNMVEHAFYKAAGLATIARRPEEMATFNLGKFEFVSDKDGRFIRMKSKVAARYAELLARLFDERKLEVMTYCVAAAVKDTSGRSVLNRFIDFYMEILLKYFVPHILQRLKEGKDVIGKIDQECRDVGDGEDMVQL